MGFPGGSDDEQICLQMWETQVQALGWEDPLEKGMATLPTPVFLPGQLHGQRSLASSVHGVAKSRM